MLQYHIVLRYCCGRPILAARHLCGQSGSVHTLCGVRLQRERDNAIPDIVSGNLYTEHDLITRADICLRCRDRVQRVQASRQSSIE